MANKTVKKLIIPFGTDTYELTDTNTTYTIQTGSSSGTINVTPSDGTASDVAVKDCVVAESELGTVENIIVHSGSANNKKVKSSGKTFSTSVTSASTDSHVPTAKAVWDAIEALPEPMTFLGSVGTGGTKTWSNLPSAAATNIGHTYKVITANATDPICKIGDTIISDGSTWIVIPSGDEPSGTVTSITLSATSPISIDDNTAITTSGSRTISHANSGATAGNYGDSNAQTPSFGGTFKVPYVSINATGHVTAISDHTVTVPSTLSNSNSTAGLIKTNSTVTSVTNYTASPVVSGVPYYKDTLVKQTNATSSDSYNAAYPLLASKQSSPTSGNAYESIYATAIAINPKLCSFKVGEGTSATAANAVAEGYNSEASGIDSHSEGYNTKSSNTASHAEGESTKALGEASHSEGYSTKAKGFATHAEGASTVAKATYSHAEGLGVRVEVGTISSVTNTDNEKSFVLSAVSCSVDSQNYDLRAGDMLEVDESYTMITSVSGTKVYVDDASIGVAGKTVYLQRGYTRGSRSHVEGYGCNALDYGAHAEGYLTTAYSTAHAEGSYTIAQGVYSHAEGTESVAAGVRSHAEGQGTQTTANGEHAEGRFNVSISGVTRHTVGIGSNASNRRNAHTITTDGLHYIPGVGGYQGTETTLLAGGDVASVIVELQKSSQTTSLYGRGDSGTYWIKAAEFSYNVGNVDVSTDMKSVFLLSRYFETTTRGIGLLNILIRVPGGETAFATSYTHADWDFLNDSGLANKVKVKTHIDGLTRYCRIYLQVHSWDPSISIKLLNSHGWGSIVTSNWTFYTTPITLSNASDLAEGTELTIGKCPIYCNTLTADTVSITNTDGVEHIGFARGGYNYIRANTSGGTLDFITNGKTISIDNIDAEIGNGYLLVGNSTSTSPTLIILAVGTGTPHITLRRGTTSDTKTDWKIYNNSTGKLQFTSNESSTETDKLLLSTTALYPVTNDGLILGDPASRWSTIYGSNGNFTNLAVGENINSGGSTQSAPYIKILSTTTGLPSIIFLRGTDSDQYADWKIVNTGDYLSFLNRETSGSTSFTARGSIYKDGRMYMNNGFYQTSDINKKNIISDLDLDKAYDLIDKCQTILYTLKDDKSNQELIGLIAQEVLEFFPELVINDEDGNLSLDYSRLTVVILKVLKDIIKRVERLERKEE